MASSPLQPISAQDWDARTARHLLNRAGFGIPVSRVAELAAMTPEKAVESFVDFKDIPDKYPEPDWLESPVAANAVRIQTRRTVKERAETGMLDERRQMAMEADEQRVMSQLRREERLDVEELKRWWLRRMIHTSRPLQEKMALFWHGHFATSAEKVQGGFANYHINKLFRDWAVGNFKMLAYEVGCSPAMLRYLDNVQNVKGRPNENWARELMELFTLGQGNYTEDDIKNAARAFTGWHTDGEVFIYNERAHDEGEKVFMGKKGNLNGDDIFDVVFEQPAASQFITRKLWNYFVYDEPSEEIVEELAGTLRSNGFEIAPMLRQMFLSEEFYSTRAMNSQIKSPAQLAVSMVSMLEIDPDEEVQRYLLHSMRLMGQDLFYPPNVKGWEGGKTWINSNTLMKRYNLSNFLVKGVVTDPPENLGRMIREERKRMGNSRETGRELRGVMMEDVGMVGDSDGPKGFQFPRAPFEAREFFRRGDNVPVEDVVDHLADHFYGRPLHDEQHAEVLDALAGSREPSTKLVTNNWDVARLQGAVHLMLSAAEFQLC